MSSNKLSGSRIKRWSLFILSLLTCVSAFLPAPATTRSHQKMTFTTKLQGKDSDMTEEERSAAMEKATKAMTAFTNTYLKLSDTKLCADKSIPAVVIKGLAEHKVSLGAPLCPCRFYDDKEAEAKDGFWNCPCVPMRERHECHCMLFLTEENDFVGEESEISFDEVIDKSSGMKM
eukprot:CAMPEP_0194035230 /NCGR_PEP_ID=MMETSP0009_2-20130614/7675_1 /TAXON_ID=210454 /ORGANISM="Grammatophora oceanica, Strain CCMP 410" /LENGTH=174 /DNA_ID=CAMNT_0038676501 /DNA_START=73 /DNA_END=597 /DNA_ORIENTATION=+